MKVSLKWNSNMSFTGSNFDNKLQTHYDAKPDFGGENRGDTPKHIFLQSIACCSSMDIVGILKKMRAKDPDEFFIEIDASLTENHPKIFTDIVISYNFKGETEIDKIKKAINLSQEKYCGLSIMIKKIVNFSFAVKLNNDLILQG